MAVDKKTCNERDDKRRGYKKNIDSGKKYWQRWDSNPRSLRTGA